MADKDHTIKNLRAAFKAERKIGQGHVSHLMDDEGHKRKATDVEQNNGHPNTHKKKLTSREVMGRIGTHALAPLESLEDGYYGLKDAAENPVDVTREALTRAPKNALRGTVNIFKAALFGIPASLVDGGESFLSAFAAAKQNWKDVFKDLAKLPGVIGALLVGPDFSKFGIQAPEGTKKDETKAPTAPAAPTAGNPNINIPVSAAMNLTPDSPRGSQSSSRER
jgi:hypothetical protein